MTMHVCVHGVFVVSRLSNSRAAFDNWSPFSGWNNPAIKQYTGGTNICGGKQATVRQARMLIALHAGDFDQNWYPDGADGFRNASRVVRN